MRWTEEDLADYLKRHGVADRAAPVDVSDPPFKLPPDDAVVIELPGEPQGKGRPRFRSVETKSGTRFVSAFTPGKTRLYERSLTLAAQAAMRGRKPLDGALRVAVMAFFGVPRSWPNKHRDAALAGNFRPTRKPDIDNVLKTLDALNGVVFVDDSQIVSASISKSYDENPRLRIEVHSIDFSR